MMPAMTGDDNQPSGRHARTSVSRQTESGYGSGGQKRASWMSETSKNGLAPKRLSFAIQRGR